MFSFLLGVDHMPSRKLIAFLLLGVNTLLPLFPSIAHSAATVDTQLQREILSIEVREDIRVVYQVNRDEWKGGVGKALAYLKRLSEAYDGLEVPRNERHISAVFHGKAGYWMLTDEAYNTHTDTHAGNPNKAVIRELTAMGVSIELCAQTMKSQGWSADDVLPEVQIVIGAYPRIIDLQLQGYAYIKF